jgi:endonuclease/exonuclease/phosphatase family metal-dependent hydrolase
VYRTRRLPQLATLAALALVVPAALIPPNSAAGSWPAQPSGVHISAVTHTAFTVALRASTNARGYRLYVSTLKSDLYYANLTSGVASAARKSFWSSTTKITAGSLTYRTVPYYYRVAAINGTQRSYQADIGEIGLRPTAPTGVQAVTSPRGTYLTWSSGRATGFRIQRAADKAMTLGVHTDTIGGVTRQFTPFGISRGHTYYFRVRALNLTTPSAWVRVSTTVQSRLQAVKVMTYNILQLSCDGSTEAGGVISPWSQRRPVAAKLIKSVGPDVIGVQEGQQWVGSTPGTRQVDNLRTALRNAGADYAIAKTEDTYPTPGLVRTGDYILYKPSVYRTYGAGGHWAIGDDHWAAYQVLQNVNSGAKFLFVTTHLTTPGGLSNDKLRESETETILKLANQMAADYQVPVVYSGDFNSNGRTNVHPLDGPAVAMRAAHINDSRLVAQTFRRGTYDSMNQYRRHPYHYSFDIDYVWAPPGVAAATYGTAMFLSGGAFVGTIPSDHNPVYTRVHFPY